jgi:GDP-L-fucose synthase
VTVRIGPMTVLIAGSSGMAGSAIAREFKAQGLEVICLNRAMVDLLDLEATRKVIRQFSPTVVIDAAAKVGGIVANNSRPVEFLSQNLSIQGNLMSAAHEASVEKFIFLGSSCIYPRDCTQPIKEEYLLTGPLEQTNSAYAIAKIAGIEMVNSYRKQYGHKWISLMPTNLYGPQDNYNLESSHVLPALIRRFIEARASNVEEVVLWGDGTPLREFLHVDDLAKAVFLATKSYDSDIHLNVGTGIEITITELATKVASLAGYQGKITWDRTKPTGTPRKVLDVSRIKSLGWSPSITLDDGIVSTIQWYHQAVLRGEVRL